MSWIWGVSTPNHQNNIIDQSSLYAILLPNFTGFITISGLISSSLYKKIILSDIKIEKKQKAFIKD